jgi:hypothetical protein
MILFLLKSKIYFLLPLMMFLLLTIYLAECYYGFNILYSQLFLLVF